MPDRIRPVVVGIVRRGDELLVHEVEQFDDSGAAYRPIGGGIEFGEHSRDALHREFDEELGVSLTDVSAAETYERVFMHDGERHHEIWRAYDCRIVEDWPYERETFTFTEPELGVELRAAWKHPDAFLDGDDVLYTESLLDSE